MRNCLAMPPQTLTMAAVPVPAIFARTQPAVGHVAGAPTGSVDEATVAVHPFRAIVPVAMPLVKSLLKESDSLAPLTRLRSSGVAPSVAMPSLSTINVAGPGFPALSNAVAENV